MKPYSSIYMRALAGLMTLTSAFQPAYAGNRMPAGTEARPLTGMEIEAYSSSGKLSLNKARLITDNDAAFEQKLAIVNAATKNLYLVYYIYSDDYSSSKFNKALIAKAQSGTKVHLMVDLLTNYSRMDLFRYLEYAGSQGNKGGYIQVKFYNKPSEKIQKDAYYFSMPCSHANQVSGTKDKCQAEKEAKLAAGQLSQKDVLMQKLWLAGTYSKNATAAGVATASGQELDFDYIKKVGAADKAKKNEFKKLAKQGKKTLESGSLGDKLSLKSLIDQLAAEIDPTIGLILGVLPVDNIRQEHKQDWDHITDYTHHKMILAEVGEGKYMFQLGGRNIEDSYHLKTDQLAKLKNPKDEKEKQKYLFKDTDFYGEVSSGGEGIAKAYMRNFEFDQMVASTAEMDKLAPYDLARGVSECPGGKKSPEFQQCVGKFFQTLQTNPGSIKEQAMKRVMEVAQRTEVRAAKFEQTYVAETQKAGKSLISIRGKNVTDELSAQDLSEASVTYIENLNMQKDGPKARTFGALTGREVETGKYISHLWQRGMESACALQKPTQVILHTAYLLPSSSMLKTLANMFDGTWDCSQVQLRVITNSFDTTDLNVINIIARGEMQAVFNKYLASYNARSARFAYYEYTKAAGQTQSLHTKLSVLGNDMIIGSANADVRSYYMDTNNGVYIRNAKGLVADYAGFIDRMIQSGEIVDKSQMFASYNPSTGWTKKSHQEDAKNMTLKMCDYWIGRLKNPATQAKVQAYKPYAVKYFGGLSQDAYDSATVVMTPSLFVPDAPDVRKACGQEPSYNMDNGYQTDQYQSCVNKVKIEGAAKADPTFNLKMQTY